MKKQWKRFAAIAGVAALIMCQGSYIPARAEESLDQDAQEETVGAEDTFGEPDAATEDQKKADNEGNTPGKSDDDAAAGTGTTEDGVSAEEGADLTAGSENREGNDVGEVKPVITSVQAEAEPVAASVQAEPESEVPRVDMELDWGAKGEGIFNSPDDGVWLYAYVYHESDLEHPVGGYSDRRPYGKGEKVTYELYYYIDNCGKEGNYYFGVVAFYEEEVKFVSGISAPFNYKKPTKRLPKLIPAVSKDGVVSYEIPEGYTMYEDYKIDFLIYEDGKPKPIFGAVLTFVDGEDTTKVDLADFGLLVEEGHRYIIMVRMASENITEWLSGEFSECILDLRAEETGSSKKKDEPLDSIFPSYQYEGSSFEDNEPAAQVWMPVTPDEIKRYTAYGRENVSFTTDAASGYSVSIYNAMQGKQCYDSFESVLGDYTIGRTYNIYPSGKAVYKTDGKARIALNIPTVMQKDGREFRMICVTEKGRPVVLTDLDSNPNTITFETDTYYAFALVYKDTK